jgi:two-component system response regulator DesR
LTAREREVLSISREEPTIAAISTRLFLSEGTVRNHLSTAIQKLEARNRGEAARIAEQNDWLDPTDWLGS